MGNKLICLKLHINFTYMYRSFQNYQHFILHKVLCGLQVNCPCLTSYIQISVREMIVFPLALSKTVHVLLYKKSLVGYHLICLKLHLVWKKLKASFFLFENALIPSLEELKRGVVLVCTSLFHHVWK